VAFDPLHMGSRVAEVLNFVNTNEELASVRHYVSVIEEVAVGKQLRQVVFWLVEFDFVFL
jgi:hypothetical protein